MTLKETGELTKRDGSEGPLSLRPGTSTRARRSPIWWMLVLALGSLLVVRALELRIPEMTRPFWEDEIHHNESLLSSANMKELRKNFEFLYMYQPLLDFWTRKAFWFPALGVDERGMRIPALVYGVALVLLVYAFALVSFVSRVNPWWAALLAFCAAVWIVNNPTQIHYSAEARHYSLIAFASVLWCGLLFLHDGRPRLLFAFATLLFANTHFFSLPMIAGGYSLQIWGDVRRRQLRWVGFHVVVLLGVIACTRFVNFGPLEYLLHRTPTEIGVAKGPLNHALGMPVLKAAFAVWLDYGTFLALPVVAWAVWLAMLLVVAVRRCWRRVPFLLAVLVALPAFFAYVRLRSDYPFRPPYFSPFLGLGLVSLLGALGFGLDAWDWSARRLSSRGRAVVAGVGSSAMALVLGVPAFATGLLSDRSGLHRVERNFSPYFLAYDEIAKEGKPIFVLHNHCWADDIPSMYFTHILRVNGVFHEVADALGCKTPIPAVRERLLSFLLEYGPRGGFVVLDHKEESCRDRAVPTVNFPGTVEKVRSVQECLWKVRGVRSLEDLARVVSAVGFRTAPGFF